MKNIIEKIPGLRWAWSVKNEIGLVILALIGFAHIAGWIRIFDSTAAPLDIGILSAPAVGVVGVIMAVFLFWVLWRVCFPREIDEWFDDRFLLDFSSVSPAVRLGLFFGSLWTVILSVGLITMALR